MRAFRSFAWSVLALNVAVVAWGAFVRATGSGAGCGRHWPTCRGEVVPRSPALETVIELTHRLTSGLVVVAVLALLVWAFRAFPARHGARRAAAAALAFVVLEALLGAALVLFGWVAKDASLARGWVMPLHLTNTFLLLGSVTLAAALAQRPPGRMLEGAGRPVGWLVASALAVVAVGATGAIAALGDTLFPSTTFAAGLRQELTSGAHVLLRLRVLHPVVAAAAGALLAWTALVSVRARPATEVRNAALVLVSLVVVELAAGLLNLALLAPVWMQLVHLVLADLTWVALIVLAAATLSPAPVEQAAPSVRAPVPARS